MQKKIFFPILTVLLSLFFLFVFYPEVLKSPSNVYFAKGGDGLKNYFGSYYHLKYDNEYLYTKSQNYPYGESVFYCDSQPFITNNLMLLKKIGIDLSDYVVLLINLLMLLSIVVGSLFLFLLFKKLKLPAWYSMLTSIIIVFLSPQLDRMGGHFSLSYVFFIPLYLYLLYGFYEKPSFIRSFFIGFISFVGLTTHAYFFAFFGFFSFFMLLFWGLTRNKKFSFSIILSAFTLQIIVPFVLFQLIASGVASDRTTYPWGFFATRSFPEAVFLPVGKPYAKFIHFSYLKWEGVAFIGLVASLVFFILLISHLRKIKTRKWWNLTENSFLNAALWTSFIALIFSFAYPFQWHMQWLWNYMGPLKQFRASGRFNWLFFYVVNILAFYLIWHWSHNKKNIFAYAVLIISLVLSSYDAYLNVSTKQKMINNRIPELSDINNKMESNKWINKINVAEFQAIFPLPYFHIGSEAYWYGECPQSIFTAFTVSWKTGLPINSALLSRTSISQTINSISLVLEPLKNFDLIDEYSDKRDFLLIVQKNESLSQNERQYLNYASLITQTDNYFVYSLPFNALSKLPKDYANLVKNELSELNPNKSESFLVADSTSPYIFESFGNVYPDLDRDRTVLSTEAKKESFLIDTLLFSSTKPVKISFWMKDLNKDLIPRSMVKLATQKPNEGFVTQKQTSVFKFVKFIDNSGWGLLEMEYTPQESNERLRIIVWNELVTGGKLSFDDLLIRQSDNNIFHYVLDDFVYKNNRYIIN